MCHLTFKYKKIYITEVYVTNTTYERSNQPN